MAAAGVAHAPALQQRDDESGAEEILRNLLRSDPTNLALLLRHAVALINLQRNEEAYQTLARAAILAPNNPDVCAYTGVVHYNMGRVARGAENMTRAIALAPERRDLASLWDSIRLKPYLAVRGVGILQGGHAPARQVFMSAAVDHVGTPGEPLSILEVGSYMGASLLTWANAIARLHRGPASILCVDTWSPDDRSPYPELNEALRSNQAFEIFLHNAEVAKKHAAVHHIRGSSASTLPMLRDHQFDIVFVDACHYYQEALSDISEGKRLVCDGGLLCGDDLELQGDVCDLDHARAHKTADYVRDPKTGKYYHPGVTLAVHEAFGRVSCFDGFWAMHKVEGRFEPVSLARAHGVLPPHWPAAEIDAAKAYFATSNEIAGIV